MKKNEARMGTPLLPQPPPRPWEAKHSAPSIQKLLLGPCAYNDDVEIDTADTLEDTDSIKPRDALVETIDQFHRPKKKKQVCSFLGLTGLEFVEIARDLIGSRNSRDSCPTSQDFARCLKVGASVERCCYVEPVNCLYVVEFLIFGRLWYV